VVANSERTAAVWISTVIAVSLTFPQTGLEQLFNQLIRPRLRNLLDEVYRDTTYLLDEDGFAEADEADIVRKRFARGWEILVEGYRVSRGSGPSPLRLLSCEDVFCEAYFPSNRLERHCGDYP
jgi:hypothetical protein